MYTACTVQCIEPDSIFCPFFLLIYGFSFSFSSCRRHIHFAYVTSSLSLRAINLSLNYHSWDKLRGPPLSSGSWLVHITLSLPYHTLWSSVLSESYCLKQEVRGGGEEAPLPTISTTYTSNPFSFSASLHHPSHSFCCLHGPTPPPLCDLLNRQLQYRFISTVKVKMAILSGLSIRPVLGRPRDRGLKYPCGSVVPENCVIYPRKTS